MGPTLELWSVGIAGLCEEGSGTLDRGKGRSYGCGVGSTVATGTTALGKVAEAGAAHREAANCRTGGHHEASVVLSMKGLGSGGCVSRWQAMAVGS